MKHTPPEKFGKDHWSTFLYAESCAVDNKGVIDRARMRRKETFLGLHNYPTRLNDGSEIADHDDYDCLYDCEAAGLLIFSMHKVELTDLGWQVAGQIRRARAEGRRDHYFQVGDPLHERPAPGPTQGGE